MKRKGRIDREIALNMRRLDEFRRNLALGGNKAVAVERSVIRGLVEVAAESEITLALSGRWIDAVRLLPDRLINPVPNAPTRQRVVFIEQLPIFLEITERVAHRMCVLAHKKRLIGRLVAFVVVQLNIFAKFLFRKKRQPGPETAALFKPRDRAIHARVDVRLVIPGLPLHNPGIIDFFNGGHRGRKARPVPRLVAERPEYDGGMVAVKEDVSLVALDDRMPPLVEPAESMLAVHRFMPFDVSLGHDVKTVAVAKIVPEPMVRIMARAHGVEIVALHKFNIPDHLVERH